MKIFINLEQYYYLKILFNKWMIHNLYYVIKLQNMYIYINYYYY